ncbi:recombinase family protein [Streptomyces sp. MAR4 CNY-716]
MSERIEVPGRPILAFVYDRCSTSNTAALDARIERCRRYAVEHGWVLVGVWVDRGDRALCDDVRPEWRRMAGAMRQAATPPVCLVDTWDRISRDRAGGVALRLIVHQAGGYCVTTEGEDDADRGHGHPPAAIAPLSLRGRP